MLSLLLSLAVSCPVSPSVPYRIKAFETRPRHFRAVPLLQGKAECRAVGFTDGRTECTVGDPNAPTSAVCRYAAMGGLVVWSWTDRTGSIRTRPDSSGYYLDVVGHGRIRATCTTRRSNGDNICRDKNGGYLWLEY